MNESYMARLGARLVDNGYPVLPIMPGTKKPGQFNSGAWRDYPGWTKHGARPTSEHELAVWSGWPDAGIGIPTGTVIGVDIDIRDDQVASRLERLTREMLGDTPAIRFGLQPKRLLVYRTAEPLSGMKAHPIEVLGLGQQFVAFADHPDTGRPYHWPQESPAELPADALPLVDETMVRAFLDQAQALVPPELWPGRLPGDATPRGAAVAAGDLRGTSEAITDALRFIPNADLDYDSWVRIGMALKGALGEDGWDLFAAWSGTSSKDIPEVTLKTWASLKPERIGAGTIYHHALAGGWNPDPALVLNGGILVNGRHPARSMLERLLVSAAPSATNPPPPPASHRPAHVPARRRARADGRLHRRQRGSAAADPRDRRQPLRTRRAHGPQVSVPDQSAHQPLCGRHGRQRRRQGPRPRRHQRGLHRRRPAALSRRQPHRLRLGPAHSALSPAVQPVPDRRVRPVPGQHRQQAARAKISRRDLGSADRALHQRRRHLLRRRIRRPEAEAAPGHRPALLLRARHHRARAVLGCAARGLHGRWQPRPLPGVPDRRRCARSEQASEAGRRCADRPDRCAPGDRRPACRDTAAATLPP